MKKLGYTLAEALMAITIIGVLAAILVPTVSKFKPDRNKIIYLKTYDALTEIVTSVASSREYYPQSWDTWNCAKAPLYNMNGVRVSGKTYSPGAPKLCEIIADGFNTEPTGCSNVSNMNDYNSKTSPLFTTPLGIDFYMYVNGSPTYKRDEYRYDRIYDETGRYYVYYVIGHTQGFAAEITFDVNGSTAPNCVYDSSTCKEPDRFRVVIRADGRVLAADAIGQLYLRTRANLRKSTTNTSISNVTVNNTDTESFCWTQYTTASYPSMSGALGNWKEADEEDDIIINEDNGPIEGEEPENNGFPW